MRKINKWLATLLAVLLVAGCLPLSALAEGEETSAPAVEEQAETPLETPEETSSEEGEPLLTAEVETYAAEDNSLGVVYVSAEGRMRRGGGRRGHGRKPRSHAGEGGNCCQRRSDDLCHVEFDYDTVRAVLW